MEILFKNFQNNKQLKRIYSLVALLFFAVGYSALDYYFKYNYSLYGDVPFYHFDFHLVFIMQWLLTPLAIYPFVKYFSFKKQSSYFLIGIGGIILSFIVAVLIFILTRIIYNGHVGLPLHTILFNGVDRMIAIGFPATFVFLGYFYMMETARQRKIIDDSEKAIIESKVKQLNAGFEPHFLFNNLNILSELVEKDVKKSQQFILALSSLYRYIVTSNKQSVIPLNDELRHARNYLDIVNIKFGDAYSLYIESDNTDRAFVLPNTLQVLIENVVKHNAANKEKPLHIFVRLKDNELIVTNEIKGQKVSNSKSTSTGLNNLKERYLLTYGKPIKILEKEDTFSVIVPLINE